MAETRDISAIIKNMERTLAAETINKIDEQVTLKGWVQTVREHGKITFIDT